MLQKYDESISSKTTPEDREILFEELRDRFKQRVIDEVLKDYKQEIMASVNTEVNEKIQQALHKQKIESLRSLMLNGFILAFIVGLTVNQITDIIGYYKGSVSLTTLLPTWILIIVFFTLSIGFYLYAFVTEGLKLLKQKKQGKS